MFMLCVFINDCNLFFSIQKFSGIVTLPMVWVQYANIENRNLFRKAEVFNLIEYGSTEYWSTVRNCKHFLRQIFVSISADMSHFRSSMVQTLTRKLLLARQFLIPSITQDVLNLFGDQKLIFFLIFRIYNRMKISKVIYFFLDERPPNNLAQRIFHKIFCFLNFTNDSQRVMWI